jgi:hypothetical protein
MVDGQTRGCWRHDACGCVLGRGAKDWPVPGVQRPRKGWPSKKKLSLPVFETGPIPWQGTIINP